jgi:hypothetical protein
MDHLGQRLPRRTRSSERTADFLAPTRYGREAVREREAALALGVRVAVHDSRQNDHNPVIWQPGQDYRMADAIHTARTRWRPERMGLER